VTTDPAPDDLIDVLAADHRMLLALLDRAAAADPGPQRSDLAVRAANAVRRHCVAEETLLHPVLRRCLEDGDRCAQADAEEHEQLEALVTELLAVGTGSPDAEQVLHRLAVSTRFHIEGVETRRLPALRRRLTVTELHELARAVQETIDPRDDRRGPTAVLG
jgi:hypothetical protein